MHDLATTEQRFQQPHSGRVLPGIVSGETQDTVKYYLSGFPVAMSCSSCMRESNKT